MFASARFSLAALVALVSIAPVSLQDAPKPAAPPAPKKESPAPTKPPATQDVPPKVAELVGTYRGEWNLFGVDAHGKVIPRATWTDVMVSSTPAVADGRAFVHTVDDMAFAGLGGKRQYQGSEGFFLDAKGALGDAFLENGGRVTRLVRLADNVWSYAVDVERSELQSLGLPADATGCHVMIKVTSTEDGHVMHRLTRITTVRWKDAELNDHALQFTSLQGFHRRD